MPDNLAAFRPGDMIASKLRALAAEAEHFDPATDVRELRLWAIKAGVLDVLNDIDAALCYGNPGKAMSDLLDDRKEARQ